jgi:membrane-associated phospholipid phosphatase
MAGPMSRYSGVAAAILALHSSRGAAAQTSDAGDHHRLRWDYARFRPSEYVASGLVSAAGLYVQFGTDRLPVGSWTNGVLFDDGIRGAFRSTTPEGRRRAAVASDYLWWTTQYFPIVVDSLIVPLATDRGNTDVAFQMLLLDWQAQSLAFLLTRALHRTVGRGRPLLEECEADPAYDGLCSPASAGGAHASFFSGHTSMAFAGAALTCAHHQHLPLYGGNAADLAACAVTLATATTTGVLRVVSDRHWATDVLGGALIGLATGYGLPYLMHYRLAVKGPEGTGAMAGIVPLASSTTLGVAVVGEL